MSYVSQFLASSSSSSGGGGKPIGAMELFAPNMGDLITLPDGSKYLKGGVIGKSSDYPNVSSVFLKQLSPFVKVGDIGCGAVWKGLTIDTLGFPMISQAQYVNSVNAGMYRITGVSQTSSSDVTPISSSSSVYPGAISNQIAVTNNTMIVGREYSTSPYVSGPLTMFQMAPGGSGASAQSNAGSGNWQAIAASSDYWVAAVRGTSSVFIGSTYSSYNSQPATTSASWTCAAANSTRFVLIATGTTTMNYSNALNVSSWTASTMPSAAAWTSVASNGSGFLAIASGGTSAASSTNGITWNTSTLPVNQNWISICWASTLGKYFAIAKGSNVGASSTDGSSWTTFTLPKTANWEGIVFSSVLNQLVICASDGTGVYMSGNGGTSWIEKSMPRPVTFEHVEYSNGSFYAFQYGYGTSYAYNPLIAKSTNGITWTYTGFAQNILVQQMESGMHVFNGELMTVQGISQPTPQIWKSTDGGVTWATNIINSGFPYSMKLGDIAYNGTRYVTLMSQYYDGANWQPSPYFFHSTSTTNTNWTMGSLPAAAIWKSVTWGGSAFVASGYDASNGNLTIARSADGITWTVPTSFPTTFVNAGDTQVLYDAVRSLHIIVLNYTTLGGALISSDNGLTWSFLSKAYAGLAQSGSRWVAVATSAVNNTYNDAQAVSLYASYTTGYSVKSNTLTPVASFAYPLTVSGTAYYTSGDSLFTIDSSLWVDNRGAPSETSGQAYYYMRVN